MKVNYATETGNLYQYYNIDNNAIQRKVEEFKVIYNSMKKYNSKNQKKKSRKKTTRRKTERKRATAN